MGCSPLLVYATGRSYEDYAFMEAEGTLMRPDAVITSTGAEIRAGGGGRGGAGASHEDNLGVKWRDRLLGLGWDPVRLEEVVGKHGFACVERTDMRVCFLLNEAALDKGDVFRAELKAAGVRAAIVLSSQPDGIFLDCMPEGVDKGSAAQFLAEHWEVPQDRVVACGDSGNDLAMLSVFPKGVVVANAHPELTKALDEQSVVGPYFARGRCAAGVVEGALHFGFFGEEVVPAMSAPVES
mmetsp:Transcript_32569/g.103753  ORF Transcript_32569/g.103753 Transcript_32569/m.103753 type:complete len:239 (+) Transcript_32569:338-1054(+)